jgi:hypothetical protein
LRAGILPSEEGWERMMYAPSVLRDQRVV